MILGGLRKLSDGTYEVRVVVPEALVGVLGKRNLTKRLGTKSIAEAKRQSHAVIVQFQEKIASAGKPRGPAPDLDIVAALAAIDAWLNNQRNVLLPAAFAAGPAAPALTSFEWKEVWLRTGLDYRGGRRVVDPDDANLRDILKRAQVYGAEGAIPEPLRIEYSHCCDQLELAVLETGRGLRRHLDALGHASPTPASSFSTPSSCIKVSDAFAAWCKKRERAQAGKQTDRAFETQIKRFICVHGDLALDRITKRHCVEFRDLMSDFPVRVTGLPKATVREIVDHYRGGKAYKKLSSKTLNQKVFAAIKAIFEDAVADGHIEINPMANISVRTDARDTPTRVFYTDTDVAALFAADIFHGVLVPKKEAAGAAQKWLPLIAALSGARLEEIAQLATTDIKQEDGIDFIHFQEGYDGKGPGYLRSLKGKTRKVPIHSALLAAGFHQFVQMRRDEHELLLFPEMDWADAKKSDKQYKVSTQWSGWWSAFSREIVPETTKSFHSFRHTVKNKLRNSSVDNSVSDAIQGHSPPNVGAKYGRDHDGSAYKLVLLRDAIERLVYPGIAFDKMR